MIKSPMLAATCKDLSKVHFPVLASPKLDGVRCLIMNGVAMSRSFKPIPNVMIQKLALGMFEGLDGELIVGDPTAPNAYRRTMSVVMSEDEPIEGLVYWVFDSWGIAPSKPHFQRRLEGAAHLCRGVAKLVPHTMIETPAALERLEERYLDMGYEGVMLRDPYGPYKEGRSTENEGYLLKLKRFCDSEAQVLAVQELMTNTNEAEQSPTGHTVRSSKKAGMVGKGTMGALHVRDLKTGVEFDIGTGFSAADRDWWWKHQACAPGATIIKYKYFPTGGKDKPRFPVFLGIRDKRDLGG